MIRLRETFAAFSMRVATKLGLLGCLALAATIASAQPANDFFTNSTALVGPSGSLDVNNIGGSKELLEPEHAGGTGGASVWYAWTAPSDGTVIFDTLGSVHPTLTELDTLLAAYTGNNFLALQEVAANDNYTTTNVTSQISFPVVAGTVYRIAVDTVDPSNAGLIHFSWRMVGISGDEPLTAGTFRFTSGIYTYADTETATPRSPTVRPSILGGTVTITRSAGSVGRVLVDYEVSPSFYTNRFVTNYFGTNIYLTNLVDNVFTNIHLTNVYITNFWQNYAGGTYGFIQERIAYEIGVTNGSGYYASNYTFLGPNFDALTNCTNGRIINNTATNVNITELFCYLTNRFQIAPSLSPNLQRTNTGTLAFDDHDMSQSFVLTDVSNLRSGPSFPNALVNSVFRVRITNARLDPEESLNVIPPQIEPTLGTALVNALATPIVQNFGVVSTNSGSASIFNFERKVYRVLETEGMAILYVRRGGPPCGSVSVKYRIDFLPPANQNNLFALQAGSDYALPNVDFTSVTGQLDWGQNDSNDKPIEIPILDDDIVEFNEDMIVQLYDPLPDMPAPCPGGYAVLGTINTATLTILYENAYGEEQPAGAVDRTHNRDFNSTTVPAFNGEPGANNTVYAVAVQPDGKSLVAGSFDAYNEVPHDRIARMNADGSVDSTFLPPIGPDSDTAQGADAFIAAMALQPDGKILIGGGFTSFTGVNRFHIARLNSNGSVDETFTPGLGTDGTVWAIVLQPDGKILIGGDFTSFNGITRNYVARLNSNGTLDESFDPGVGPDFTVLTIALHTGGTVLIGGDFNFVEDVSRDRIARLLPNGRLDETFNPFSGADATVYSIVTQPDGKVLIGGAFTQVDLRERNRIARLNSNGGLDLSFDPGKGANDTIFSLALQTDGRVLAGGLFTSFNESRRIGMVRLYTQGTVDSGFLDTAYNQFAGLINHYYATTAFNPDLHPKTNFRNFVFAIGIEPDGNIVIGGSFYRVGGGFTRDDIRHRSNVCRLIGGATPGSGSIELLYQNYSVDEDNEDVYISLVRTNGFLGEAAAAISVELLPSGTGAVEPDDFFLSAFYRNPRWPTAYPRRQPDHGWMVSEGYYSYNFFSEPLRISFADVWINIIDNSEIDGNRAANLRLSNPSGTDRLYLGGENIACSVALGRSLARLTIVDDDALPGVLGFSTPTFFVNENVSNKLATITITRTNGSEGSVSVLFTTQQGGVQPATPGTDYTARSGVGITFNPGETSKSVTVRIEDDSNVEPDETIVLRLHSPNNGATLGLTNAILTIVDNDFGPGRVNFASTTYATNESGDFALITLTRSGGSAGVLAVYYATSNGTAIAGTDYIGVTNVISWTNGDTAPKTFVVPLQDDVFIEANETVNLRLFSATVNGATNTVALGNTTTATLNILNDDSLGVVRFSTSDYFINENGGSAYITVVRTGGTAETVAVNFSAINGTAIAGFDFVATNGTLTFGPGVFSRTFTVPIIDREFEDLPRFITLLLSDASPTNGLGSNTTAVIHIIDDELNNEPAGSLDTSYASSAGMNGDVLALALQLDGQLIVGGDFTVANNVTRNRIARLKANGTIDPLFSTTTGGMDGAVRSIDLQTDGRVLVAGDFFTVNGINRNRIARLASNGAIDETFNPGSGADNPVHTIVETLVGGGPRRVLIGGDFTVVNGVTRHHIARLMDTGTIDPSFEPGIGPNDSVYAVVVQDDGKIIIGGSFTAVGNVPRNHIARLNADGSLDLSFDPGAGANDTVRAVALQIDGRVVVGGLFTEFNGFTANRYVRLNPDGSRDTTFTSGVGANDTVNTITIQGDTRIILGGQFTLCNGVTRNHITRLNNDGTVDPTINFGAGANNFVAATLVQPDAKIILGGGFTQYHGTPRPRLARIYGGSIAGSGNFEFTSANYSVGESGTNVIITVRRRGGTQGAVPGGNVSVDVTASDITALHGVHFIGGTTNLVFPVGEVLRSFIIPIIDDFEINPDRIAGLTLGNIQPPQSAVPGNQPVSLITIINDDSAVAFAAATFSRNENAIDGQATIQIVRSGSTVGTSSVDFLIGTNGTATPLLDFTPVTNSVTFNPGETLKTVTIGITNDAVVEGDETVALILTNAVGALLLTPFEATLTIVDDDFAAGRIGFGAPAFFVAENGLNAAISVIRTNGRSGAVSATYFTTDVSASTGLDYDATSGSVGFAEGETNKTIFIPIRNDTSVEGPEIINVTLTNVTGGATLLPPTTVPLTILDDDVGITFSSPVYLVGESGPTVTITVLRINGSNGVATVNYSTTNGTALAGSDYSTNSASGTLEFKNGETIKSFTISIFEDTIVEGDETFGVILSNPSPGVVLLNPTANVTVVDNDTGLSFGPATYVVDEVSTNLIVTVVRSNANTVAQITVAFATTNGTATAGADYVGTSGVLTFTNGESFKTISVPILPDAQVEGDEAFNLTLFNPTGGAQFTGPTVATVTIIDNDAGFAFSSGTYALIEGQVVQTITVYRTGITNSFVTVNYATSDGTATNGADYVGTSGTLIFTNGDTVKTFDIQVIDDTIEEGAETVFIKLTNPTGQASLLDPNAATLTIVDNDGSLILPAGTLLTEERAVVNNAVDVGETVTALFAMRNISGFNTTNLTATLLATNGIIVPSGPQNYGQLNTGGASVSRPFTFTANATNGSVILATFQLQDGPINYGRVTFSFLLGTSTATFSNLAAITMPNSSNSTPSSATPYPSVINIAGLGGSVSKAVVTLTNVAHEFPDDIDILLASPASRSVILMSDVGGSPPITNVVLTFDDASASATALPDTGALITGTNKTTNIGSGDTFPQPAPPAPYGTNLSAFNGLNPNGAWSLYVVDDSALHPGSIARGWYLTLTTSGLIPAMADLSVTMTAPSPGITGSNLVYTVLVTNHGPWAATSVVLTNLLPANAAYLSSSNSVGSISTNGNGRLVWNIGTLGKDGRAIAQITVLPSVAGVISSTSTVVGAQVDPNADNSTTTLETLIAAPSADLALSLVDAPSPAYFGTANLTFSLLLTNQGPATATAVSITNTLPNGLLFLSATPANYVLTTNAGNTVIAFTNIGNLGDDQTFVATIVSRPLRAGEFTNTATANSAILDPFKGNNTAAVKSVIEYPELLFSVQGNNLVIAWPVAAGNYILEATTSLAPPVVWTPVTVPAPAVIGGERVVTIPIGTGNRYFRLRTTQP